MSESEHQEENENKKSDVDGAEELTAAREAAEQATAQAKELAGEAFKKISLLHPSQIGYLGCLFAVVLLTFIFDMASFYVYNDGPVSETQARAERMLQAQMNSKSKSVFFSSIVGKLTWLSAAGGIGLVLWATITKVRAGWVPLAQIGFAVLTFVLMLLIYLVGFPDLSGLEASIISNARSSATLLGYWLPLLASGGASFLSVQRIFFAK